MKAIPDEINGTDNDPELSSEECFTFETADCFPNHFQQIILGHACGAFDGDSLLWS